jgi:hypothetical protein
MEPYFFRVEHELLRSAAFQDLGGSAIKVYLVIGLYADFDTGWAYPSIRTIAQQGGLSRQTVLDAIKELTTAGLLATRKEKGRSTAYRIIHGAPERPRGASRRRAGANPEQTRPFFCAPTPKTGPKSLEGGPQTGPESLDDLARFLGPPGQATRPEQEPGTREEQDNPSIPIPGTPFRLAADGRLLVSVDLQELLTSQGIPRRLAERLATQKAPEDVAKVLLNAFYLQSQGKLQNGPGYIRAGLEDGYDLLPQVANRLESRRRELQEQLQVLARQRGQHAQQQQRDAEEAAIRMVLDRLSDDELQDLVHQAIAQLPGPLVRRNPTLSNPFVRAKVYELAGGEP